MSRPSRIAALAALATLCAPGAAMAQGMPQLDFNTPLTLTQVGWGAVIFLLLYLLLTYWALPQVSAVIDQRTAKIDSDLATARAVQAEARRAMDEMNEAIARARAEAQGKVNAAVERAKQEAAARAEAENKRLEAELASAEERIAASRRDAMGGLGQVAIETAITVIQRLTGSPPDRQAVERGVTSALAGRSS